MDDEIACFCKRIRDGVDMSAAKNYFHDIKEVKPGGHFLIQMSTVKACRSAEFMAPTLCDRSAYEKWDEIGRPGHVRQGKRAGLKRSWRRRKKNPLPDEVLGKLEDIMRRADEALKE